MERIPHEEIHLHPHSFCDSDGRLFQWRGELLRGISRERAPFFAGLFESGEVARLARAGLLIDTEPTTLSLDGYGMVVRHRRLPFVSYPTEWPAAMLRDAAITTLALAAELAARGLTLKDAHPWNLVFDAYRPVWVDFGSIVPWDGGEWPALDEFLRFSLRPLALMAAGQDRIARCLMPEDEGVGEAELAALASPPTVRGLLRGLGARSLRAARGRVPGRVGAAARRGLGSLRRGAGGPEAGADVFERLRREVEDIGLPPDGARPDAPAAAGEAWPRARGFLRRALEEIRPASVLDVGSNAGWRSLLAARLGAAVVSFDADPRHAARLYAAAREGGLPILPLVMDVTKPTPARGISSHWLMAATERLRCDMVVALDLLDRLVFDRRLDFRHVVEGFAAFAERWLVVEFVGRGGESPGTGHAPGWYTAENFAAALGARFRNVTVAPGDGAERTLLLCEK
jgi:hypothetical protein